MNDPIDRQAAIDAVALSAAEWDGMYVQDINGRIREALEKLPSAQPDLPEWARKVEEYRTGAPDMIHNPLAWALYQVWKEYDR